MSNEQFEDANYQRFAQAISYRTMEGYLVMDRNDRMRTAVLSKPAEKINHVLHLILALVTCGAWAIVWLILYFTAKKEQRIQISMDPAGNLQEQSVRVG